MVFGRLLFALPNLSVLICASVRWTKAEYKASMIPPMAVPLKLICMSMSFAYWSTDLVDWLLAVVSHESLRAINLRRIWMKDMKIIEKILSTVGPSLRHLVIGCDILKADEESMPDYHPVPLSIDVDRLFAQFTIPALSATPASG